MTEREDGAAPLRSGAHARAGDVPPRRGHLTEARLEVATEEGLFRESDDDDLPEASSLATSERRGVSADDPRDPTRRAIRRRTGGTWPPRRPAPSRAGRSSCGPRAAARTERARQHEPAEREPGAEDERVVPPPDEEPRRREEHEAHARRHVPLREEDGGERHAAGDQERGDERLGKRAASSRFHRPDLARGAECGDRSRILPARTAIRGGVAVSDAPVEDAMHRGTCVASSSRT